MNEAAYHAILRRLGVQTTSMTAQPQSRLLSLSLPSFAREGQPLEVRVPWWPQTLWFVPDERYAGLLQADGISRGRIWTARELLDLMATRDPADAARVVAIVKLEFDGEVVEVRTPPSV